MDKDDKRPNEANDLCPIFSGQQEDCNMSACNANHTIEQSQRLAIRPSNIVLCTGAGRKRTSSGSFKNATPSGNDHDLAEGSQGMTSITEECHTAVPATICEGDRSQDRTNISEPDQMNQEENNVNPMETSLESSKSDLKHTKKVRKHRRLISQLPWKDESRFDPEIR